MKKLIYLLLVGLAFGCKKDSPTAIEDEAGVKLYSNLSNVRDVESKKVAYGLLSSVEKFDLWKARFNSEVISGKFSDSQIEAIKEISSLISPDFFIKGDKKEIFKSITLPNWIKSNSNIFTKDEIFLLLFNIAVNTTPNTVLKTVGNSTKYIQKACDCAVGSNYTCYMGGGSFYSCYTLAAGCPESTSGCGAFWDDECDGNFCYPSTIPPSWPPLQS